VDGDYLLINGLHCPSAGQPRRYPAGSIARIVVNAGAGDDTVTAAALTNDWDSDPPVVRGVKVVIDGGLVRTRWLAVMVTTRFTAGPGMT
jgi:hypothetical protein